MDVEMEREPEYSKLRQPGVVSKKLPWDLLFEMETDVPRITGQSASLEISSNLFDVRRDGLPDKGQGKDVLSRAGLNCPVGAGGGGCSFNCQIAHAVFEREDSIATLVILWQWQFEKRVTGNVISSCTS